MRTLISAAIGAAALFTAGSVAAQQVGIGTMGQGTSGYSMGAAIARVLDKEGINALIQPSSGTSTYLPLINSGELDFGIANVVETAWATKGMGPFEGRPLENLRATAVLYPFRVGVFVADDSDIQSISDLKGKRVTYGFTSQVTLKEILDALLASGGLAPGDITPVMVPNVVRGADDLAAGRADAAFFAMGSGKVSEVDATVGGVRFLPVPNDPESVARLRAIVPEAYVDTVEPAPELAGVAEPIPAMMYDYVLVTGAHVPEETVKKVVEALAKNKDELAAAFSGFADFEPDEMAKDLPVEYHEGAIAAYEEMGAWPPKSE